MSDDGSITVDIAALREIAGDLEDILRALGERLTALYERTEPVVLAWKGEAREAFVDELDRWDRQMADLQAAQAWLHAVVTTGHANYSAAQRATLRGWGGA
ncbi:WXG100 family type VII secretion target [Streptomyces sp. NPDC006482]|uniref:WXG100 family type VII secretion target n=1 Tax=unclassified Streptomyces TaxID=2593676 RepID=UPI00224F9806|nr:WXG100 family type VII secretion target [Streptomyces sp. NBC_00094]MCX5394124.1 WXG100 family type VII secretion target [Streptomyces sp. NBC_00094]